MEEHKIMEIIREGNTATEWGTYARARVIATILDRVKKGKPIFHEVIEPQE